ncbi:MAG: DUF2993 domain-containing protein [Elainellaceae cyanobacterium]
MGQPRIIRSILTSALQLWLRSLVEEVDTLDVDIQASDRQLLNGYIPRTLLKAEGAVYAGLRLTQIHLQANGIRVNLRQILRGKPFQLADPIAVQLQAQVSAEDLNRSLRSELLSTGLMTLTQQLLPQVPIAVTHVTLAPGQLIFRGKPKSAIDRAAAGKLGREGSAAPVELSTQVSFQGATLYFKRVHLLAHPTLTNPPLPRSLPDQALSLGEVEIQTLILTPDKIVLAGELKVLP